MIRHYLIIAYRNLWRNKLHSILNIFGLSIGITCFILIMLYVRYELSFEKFNPNASRIYRIAVNGMLGNTEIHQPERHHHYRQHYTRNYLKLKL